MLTALIYTLSGIAFTILVGYFLSAPKYSGPVSGHFNGKRFINPGNIKAKGLSAVFKWMFTRQKGKWSNLKGVSPGDKPPVKVEDQLCITFINHSTFLIQTGGLNILTDPIWSRRASPFSWAGPQRRRPPGINFEDLPPIDIVLLSHNHYDHLNVTTMKNLHKKFSPRIFTSLGISSFLEKNGISGAVDMDWWDELELNEMLKLVAVPAQHFSGRGMFDRDATLWCGFVIRRREARPDDPVGRGNIYFAADSGYNSLMFKETAQKLAPIHVAILPIGAYKPSWFMSPIHTSPGEAIKIHLDLQAQKSIASHFGTFPLADEGEEEMYHDLRKAMEEYKLSDNDFLVMKEGEGIYF